MACLKCSTMTDGGALLCDACADVCFEDPRFFLNPTLVGPSLFKRMRAEGSATVALGPVPEDEVVLVPSSDLEAPVRDASIEGMTEDETGPFCDRCDAILAHLGVPLKFDRPVLLLTDDAAVTVATVARKVSAVEELHPNRSSSDLCLRMGVVYWCAYHGILMRTAPEEWAEEKKRALYGMAREFLSKVPEGDDLHSIAEYNLGVLGMDARDWVDAAEHLTNALKHFPDDPLIVESLARAHLEMGNQMDAMARIDEALASEENFRLWILKGRLLRDMQMPNEALECFGRVLSIDARCLDAHDHVISILRELGRAEDASLAERQRAMAKTPDLDQRVSDLINELKKASAEPVVPRARRTRPPRPPPPVPQEPEAGVSYPVELAREALRSGNPDSAVQMAEHILREDPDSRETQLVMVEALVATGDLARAATVAHTFYEKGRSDPRAWYWRGVIADKEGKWGAAVQYFSKAVTLDPGYVDSWLAMGECLLRNEKVSGADESFSRVLQVDGANASAWLGKAKAMRQLGRWGAAIQCLDKYNTLAPNDKDAWLLKADLLFDKEKHRRAIEAYDRYLQLDQDDSYVLGRKGIALNAIGMVDEAKKCLEESVRLDPNNRDAAKWLRSISEGGGA